MRNINFVTEEEATHALHRSRREYTGETFCPLIKENCRPDCVALFKGCVTGREGNYAVEQPYCAAYSLSGPRE